MASERIGDMTMAELISVIQREVNMRRLEDERVKRMLTKPEDPRTVEQILESIEQHMWTPLPGSPSTLELLREDRDR